MATTDNVSYKINSDCDITDEKLGYFKLAGKIFAKAIFERIPINSFLDTSLIKHLTC